jgi:hypothetical protein
MQAPTPLEQALGTIRERASAADPRDPGAASEALALAILALEASGTEARSRIVPRACSRGVGACIAGLPSAALMGSTLGGGLDTNPPRRIIAIFIRQRGKSQRGRRSPRLENRSSCTKLAKKPGDLTMEVRTSCWKSRIQEFGRKNVALTGVPWYYPASAIKDID